MVLKIFSLMVLNKRNMIEIINKDVEIIYEKVKRQNVRIYAVTGGGSIEQFNFKHFRQFYFLFILRKVVNGR